ncbi:MAG: PAS domain S-box protein [Eubacteriales bacterium]
MKEVQWAYKEIKEFLDLESFKDAIFLVGREGNFLYFNQAAGELFGYTKEEMASINIETLFKNHDDRKNFIMKIESNGYVKDYPINMRRKDGKIINVLVTSVARKYEVIGHLYQGIMRDGPKGIRAEEALREAHAQIKQLLASISSILIGVSMDGLVTQWNSAAEKSFGVSAGDVIGKPFSECGIKLNLAEINKCIKECKGKKISVPLDNVKYTRPDGKDGLLGFSVNPVNGAVSGELFGCVLLGSDISERKKIEARLVLSQKLESIGQMAAGIAHEINTPMQYIGDNARFFKDAFNDIINILKECDEAINKLEAGMNTSDIVNALKQKKKELDLEYLIDEIPMAIEQSLEGIERVRKLVLAMKDFSHPGISEKMFSDINRAIEGTVALSKNEWKYVAELDTVLEPDLPPVYCSIGEINQVVLNMIVNAAQAIKEAVDAGFAKNGKITVKTRNKGDYIQIIINDTGPGIPQSILHKIFDPFFTTKEVGKGTGQGLAIAHDIITNKHKGTIDVELEPGKGTTFIINLPVIDPVINESGVY